MVGQHFVLGEKDDEFCYDCHVYCVECDKIRCKVCWDSECQHKDAFQVTNSMKIRLLKSEVACTELTAIKALRASKWDVSTAISSFGPDRLWKNISKI
jgi:hypothetical protein